MVCDHVCMCDSVYVCPRAHLWLYHVSLCVWSECVCMCMHTYGCVYGCMFYVLCVCPCMPVYMGPGCTYHCWEQRGVAENTMAPAYRQLLGGEVSSLSWRLISPWEDALIPVTHSLEEFKATRWRGVSGLQVSEWFSYSALIINLFFKSVFFSIRVLNLFCAMDPSSEMCSKYLE